MSFFKQKSVPGECVYCAECVHYRSWQEEMFGLPSWEEACAHPKNVQVVRDHASEQEVPQCTPAEANKDNDCGWWKRRVPFWERWHQITSPMFEADEERRRDVWWRRLGRKIGLLRSVAV